MQDDKVRGPVAVQQACNDGCFVYPAGPLLPGDTETCAQHVRRV